MKQIKKLRKGMEESDDIRPLVTKPKKKKKRIYNRFDSEDDYQKYKTKALISLLDEEE